MESPCTEAARRAMKKAASLTRLVHGHLNFHFRWTPFGHQNFRVIHGTQMSTGTSQYTLSSSVKSSERGVDFSRFRAFSFSGHEVKKEWRQRRDAFLTRHSLRVDIQSRKGFLKPRMFRTFNAGAIQKGCKGIRTSGLRRSPFASDRIVTFI